MLNKYASSVFNLSSLLDVYMVTDWGSVDMTERRREIERKNEEISASQQFRPLRGWLAKKGEKGLMKQRKKRYDVCKL